MEKNMDRGLKITTVNLVKVSIIASIAFIVMYLEFPLVGIFPPFLQVDLSDVVVFIGGVLLGPVYVIIAEFIKNLLHLILKSQTGGIGELSNFIAGVCLIFPAVYIYKRNSLKKLIIGLTVGTLIATVVMSVLNYFVFLPIYGVASENLFENVIYIFAPFNLVRGIIISISIFILDKALSGYYEHLR